MSTNDNASRRVKEVQLTDHGELKLWLRLLSCSNLIEAEIRRRLRDTFSCTLPQFDVLAQLDSAARSNVRGLTMSELSRRLMVTNGNLTGLVERLVGEGLVSRATHRSDRRAQIVRLTQAGKRALNTMAPAHEEWIRNFFSALGPEEQVTLYACLGDLRTSVRDAIAATPE